METEIETVEMALNRACPPEDGEKLKYPLLRRLLLVNSSIYHEALPILLEVNTIVLRESSNKEVRSTEWFRDWLDKRDCLYNNVRSIDFQEYSVTKEIHEGEGPDPDVELMGNCTNLRHVTVHLGHYHFYRPKNMTLEEDRKRWAPVFSSFDRASIKWQGRGPTAAKSFAQKESLRMTTTYKLDVIGQKRTLRSLDIVPSAMYYREQKGEMSDFFSLVNNELTQSFKEWLGEDTKVTISPCRARVSCNYWMETIAALN